MKITFNT
ncbi:hypothetical protein VCEM1676A_003111A, partial [Vibrio cholerae O1 str. EM-1676A]